MCVQSLSATHGAISLKSTLLPNGSGLRWYRKWLPWLKQQQESGAIQVSQQTASKYMKLASNYNRERNLIEAPSIRAALALLQVKASLSHGEWLPWLNGEIESGRLKVGTRQVQRYIKLASNTTRESFLLEAASIHAALELLEKPDAQPTAD